MTITLFVFLFGRSIITSTVLSTGVCEKKRNPPENAGETCVRRVQENTGEYRRIQEKTGEYRRIQENTEKPQSNQFLPKTPHSLGPPWLPVD